MRTTLTLEDDVAALLRRMAKRLKVGPKQLVNRALREGLARLEAPRVQRGHYETKACDLGDCLVGSLDDISETVAVAEGEAYR